MNITEKQKQQLIDLNDSRVNEILNLGLKVGEWYKKKDYGDLMFYFNGKYTNKNNVDNYGFDYNGIFQEVIGVHKHEVNEYYEATKQEIEQALTNEAKRRGFKQGVKFKCLITHKIGEMIEDYLLMNGCFGRDNSLESAFKNDIINGVLFKDGVWAEIIDDKSKLKEEIKELRRKLKSLEEKL